MNRGRRWFLASSAAAVAVGRPGGLQAAPAQADGKPPVAGAPGSAALALVAAPIAGTTGRLSYDGSASGPVLRVKPGVPLAVTLTNRLDGPTALQWHGLRGVNAVDAAAEPPPLVAKGASITQSFTPPDSGLVWVHAAALPGLPDQTAAGLRAVVIVEEATPPTVDRDLLVVLSDGATPGTIVINGSAAPLHETIVTGGRLRLRLLNASTATILMLAIDGARPQIIAIDGQPSDLFEPLHDTVPAGPGARFEMMLDAPAKAGATVSLLARGARSGEGPAPQDSVLMALTTDGAARAPLPPIAALPANPALPPAIALEQSSRATLRIEAVAGAPAGKARWRLNGVAALTLPPKPLLSVPRGKPVTFGFDNRAPVAVPLRVHGQAMRLLHANDDGWEPYWRDEVILMPGTVTHVAFIPDVAGRWLIDSAVFDQASGGLRTWFMVT